MVNDNEQSNGSTPLKAKNLTNANKRGRFDSSRNLNTSNSSIENDESEELKKEKEKNRDLRFVVGKMQGQLDSLSKRIEDLTSVILELQNEKKKLIELIEKKSSPSKSKNKHETKSNRSNGKTTQTSTALPKAKTTSIQATIVSSNASKGDDDMQQTASAHTPQTQAAEHISGVSDLEQAKDVDMSEIEQSVDEKKKVEETDGSSSESSDDEDDENIHTSKGKKTQHVRHSLKTPPIDVWTDNRADIQREIQSIVPDKGCLYGRVNNGKFRVFPCDSSVRSTVIDYLKEKEYQYNTYTPNDEKMINVLIKGLDHIDEPTVIKNALAENGFEPYDIKKHTTGYMRKNSIKSNLWHIILQPNTDTTELFKIRAIDNAIVKFDFLRKPKVIQCRRCQRFNHSASNCSLPYRCVKCTETHEPGKCNNAMKKNKFKPKCVNCKGDHTANDTTNCEVFKKAIAAKTNKQKPQKTVNNKQAIRTTQSYADRVKSNVTSNARQNKLNTNDHVNIDKFMSNQNKMMNEFMATMQKMQQQFISSFARKNGQ